MHLAAILLLPAVVAAAPCPTRASWPTKDWPSRAAEVAAARPAQVAALEEYAFTLVGRDEERLGIRTDSLLLVHRGAIIYERYARGYDPGKRHIGWSVTKSVVNALVGVAVGKGALSLDDSICRHLPKVRGDACRITVRHLLEFASGLDWQESYENQSYQVSSVLAMLYGLGRADMATFVGSHSLRAEPGQQFYYSSGDSMLLAAVADAAMRKTEGEQWPWETLFRRLGMSSAVLERDRAGAPVGSSHFFATPRDFARFGYLFLNDGCWEGERVLPEGWVASSSAVSQPVLRSPADGPQEVQGWHFWLNRPVPQLGWSAEWPSAPEDAYAALGHWGQSITVIPSLDLIVVRTADDREPGFEKNKLYQLAIEVAR